MEDFLKDRPVLDPKTALVVAADTKTTPAAVKPAAPTAASPFAELRGASPSPAPHTTARAGALTEAVPAAPQALKGDHGTKVQTVVERGRVTRIIVTCTCGKVTEIACQY